MTTKPIPQKVLDQVCAEKGHVWESVGYVLTSNPPQYPEKCKICDKRRIGTPQEPMSYRYP